MKSTGQLNAGDVFVSKAGNLPCQAIAHALGPVWKGGSHNEEDVLQNAIEKCLKKTEKRGYSSIAIPALSTGAFNYPADKACAAIVEQVVNQSGLKHVKKVVLCDINQATVKCFVMALQAEVKDVKIHCKLRFLTVLVHLTVLRLTNMSRLVAKPTMWFPNRSDTNRPVQLQKQVRSLKFWS